MRTTNVRLHNPLKAFLLGGLLALVCGAWPQQAQASAAVSDIYCSYELFAQANEWVELEIDGVTGKTNLIWESGYQPTDDKDGDGLSNLQEFRGWKATINGYTGWFTYDCSKVTGTNDPAFFGFGPDPESFDSDCDGISDLYESTRLITFAGTNPNSDDTDSDTLKDPVEIYAGLDPKDDGFVYTTFVYKNGIDTNSVKLMDPVMTNKPVTTLQWPKADIDGDGMTSLQELKKANKDINFADGCPMLGSVRAHFPTIQLDEKAWTSPFDCDTDSDWMLDSFEKFFAKAGFSAVSNEPPGDDFDWASDPEKDGLVNFREQCLHPLLSYGWVAGPPYPTWPYLAGPCALKQKEVTSAKLRFREPGRGGCLHGTVGYLSQAQYSKFGDVARYFTIDYAKKGGWSTNDVKVIGLGLPGSIHWPSQASYWTEPRPAINVRGWDTDGDFMSDGWEVEHGLNPMTGMAAFDLAEDEDENDSGTLLGLVDVPVEINPGGALGDPDQDGLLNYEEYYGQDGYRIDYITGTGDETIPWITRSMNYRSQSSFEDYLHTDPLHNVIWFLGREPWQAPNYYEIMTFGLEMTYPMATYPGFFHPAAYATMVTNWVWAIDPADTNIPPIPFATNEIVPNLVPTVGVPSFPYYANDMAALAPYYGTSFVTTLGAGGFQPYATSFGSIYYAEPAGTEDGRYTPGVDSLWYAINAPGVYTPPVLVPPPGIPGDTILADPGTLLTNVVEGRPITDNTPLMVPMPGWDSDSDGLSDSMEIQMDVARGKQPTSPVQSLSPLVARSAKIVTNIGSSTLLVDYPFYFARDFTVESWVFLEGTNDAAGSFIKGYAPWPPTAPTMERKAYDLGVTNVVVNGQVVATVPYAGMHTVGGKWYQASATRPLPRNRWIHLAATFKHGGVGDGNTLSLIVDGTLVQSRQVLQEGFGNYLLESWGTSESGPAATIKFGSGTGFADRLWIDELRIWGVERTPAEVSASRGILLEGRQVSVLDGLDLNGSLLAYFNFDDGGDVAVDGRHRAYSSMINYDFPGAPDVGNRLFHEFLYPDRGYALPTKKFGGGFVFDAGRTAPVNGELDNQRGELDSDGDSLPDSWELIHEFNPFAWFTPEHVANNYDLAWRLVGAADVLISRSGLTFSSTVNGGTTSSNVTVPGTTKIVNGELVTVPDPNVVLIGDYSMTTNSAGEGTNATSTLNTVTNWEIKAGQVSGFILDGQTWWVSKGGAAVAQVGVTGKVLSDADGDIDSDGLSNLYEYWSRTNPRRNDTDENGIADGDEDFDLDGLVNQQEARNASRPDLADTDDDGMTDTEEVFHGTTPSDSASPKKSLAAYFTGKPGSWLEIMDRSAYAQSSWTLEAKILPARVDFLADGQGASVFRRGVEDVTNGYMIANYELRVVRSGAFLYPEARFVYKTAQGKIGVPISLRGTHPLPVSAVYNPSSVTHLAVSYDGAGKTLSLYVNGALETSRQDINISAPSTGEGPASTLRIGERFNGFVDDLRLWSGVRGAASIAAAMSTALTSQEEGLAAHFNFDDGGWPMLTSNTWNTARITNLLYSVNYLSAPSAMNVRDGDTWVVGTNVFVNESGVVKPLTNNVGPVFDGVGVVAGTGTERPGDFGWNHAEGLLYKYNGTNWLRWGKSRYCLADARATIQGSIATRDEMLLNDPTPGDMFVCPPDGVVYIYNGTVATNDTMTVSLTADPLLDGHRFYLRPMESIVEWKAASSALVTVATAAGESGLFIRVQSDGLTYKSEDKIWRRWGFVPSTEDYTVPRDWENQWAAAAKMSGVAEFYTVGAVQTNYVPSGGQDTDGDGLPDSWEVRYGLNPLDGGFGGVATGGGVDLDGDGRIEYVYNEDDFINGAWGDPDNDGLNNRAEWLAGTNPFQFDTDGDGTGDYDSPTTGATYGSLYMDGDNIPDGWESLFPSACSPLRYDANLDPDGDGWDNYSEYMAYYLTMNASVYTVTTNTDGAVTTNFTSGTGYSIPYCKPDSASSYPKPQITFRFKSDCPEARGTLRIWAFMDSQMNCPDAMTSIAVTNSLEGKTLRLTDFTNGGHLRQGKTYFMAFIDANSNGQWDESEPMGFSEYMPDAISWGEATVEIALREKANGFLRAGWSGAAVNTNVAASTTSTVYVLKNSSIVYQASRGGCSANRSYLHEFDFRNATGVFANMSTGAMLGNYEWRVQVGTNVLKSGVFTVDYPSTLTAPTVLNPMGTILYAKEKLRMKLDPATTQIQIMILKAGNNAVVLDSTQFAPYIDKQGIAEMDLPALAGWGSFTNGQYWIQVRAFNPRATVNSAWTSLSVSLNTPAAGGPGMISGRAYYRGWAANASVVVVAYEGSGFDQRPVAKVKTDSNFNYKLMGLPIGTYFVRAFHDQNGNGLLDDGEAWGVVKGAPATVQSINWVVATISRRGGLSIAPAVGMYAVDYSSKAIQVRSAVERSGNDLVIHDADSDNDGLPDIWEKYYAGSLSSMNEFTDSDSDGLPDIQEFGHGTQPTVYDTDGDGLGDGVEVNQSLSNPLAQDSDGDGLGDLEEATVGLDGYITNPNLADTDGDGLSDSQERAWIPPTNPLNPDSDYDTLPDGWEASNLLNPLSGLGAHGAAGDPDGDTLTNAQELAANTNPRLADTDGDGMGDAQEVAYGLDPLSAEGENGWDGDKDGDGVSNGDEIAAGLNPTSADRDLDGLPDSLDPDPLNWDSDGDGYNDGVEVLLGKNPTDPASMPASGGTAPTDVVWTLAGSNHLAVKFTVGTPTGNPVILEFLENNDLRNDAPANWIPSGVQRAVAQSGTYTNAVPDLDGDGILNIRIRTK